MKVVPFKDEWVCVCVWERERERDGDRNKERERKRQGERRGRGWGKGRGGEEEERRFPNPLWGVALGPLLAWRQSQAQRTLCKWNLGNKHYSFFFFKNLITLPLLLYPFRLLMSKSFSFLFLETLFSESLVFLKKFKKKFFFFLLLMLFLGTMKKAQSLHIHSLEILQTIQPDSGSCHKELLGKCENFAKETHPLHCLLEERRRCGLIKVVETNKYLGTSVFVLDHFFTL